jgi:hypothetical protein
MQHTTESLEAPESWLAQHVLAQPNLEKAPHAHRAPPSLIRPLDTAPEGTPESGFAPGSGIDRSEASPVSTPGMRRLSLPQTEVELRTPGNTFTRSQTPSVVPPTIVPAPRLSSLEAPAPVSPRVELVLSHLTLPDLPMIRPAPIQSPTFPASDKSAGTPTEPRPIQVRIGTIEVRATTPPAPPKPPGPTPQGFDDYAQLRNYLTWGQY